MLAYWLLFGMWGLGAVQFARKNALRGDKLLFWIAIVLTAAFIGLRFQVGGDWQTYLAIYELIYFQPLFEALRLSDPGYAFFNWVGAQADWGVWVANLACGLIFAIGVGRLARDQPNPWLAMLIAVPYLVIVVAMGYTRQAAAIGVICYAVVDASERKIVRLVAFAAVAALFHKTAVLMLLVMLTPVFTRRLLIGAIGTLLFALFFSFFLGAVSDKMVTNYAQSGYDSQGAGIRVAMNVVAGVLMLLFRNRMDLDPYQRTFWTVNALLAAASAVALYYLESSAGVDRIALFLIPLQLVTFSRLPYALSASRQKPLPSVVFAIMAYSLSVQYVWLNYADNARAWLPYRNYAWQPVGSQGPSAFAGR